jgi:hypothetical protein
MFYLLKHLLLLNLVIFKLNFNNIIFNKILVLYASNVCLLYSHFVENHPIWILKDGPLIFKVVPSEFPWMGLLQVIIKEKINWLCLDSRGWIFTMCATISLPLIWVPSYHELHIPDPVHLYYVVQTDFRFIHIMLVLHVMLFRMISALFILYLSHFCVCVCQTQQKIRAPRVFQAW